MKRSVLISLLLLLSTLLSTLFTVVNADPLIVAHRGGTADYPENTVMAISHALNNQADLIWISVQLSKDGVVVLYRPSDLSALTNGKGKVSSFSYAQLSKLDAAYFFKKQEDTGKETYPYRNKGISIPDLSKVLAQFPFTRFFIDIKSPDAEPKVMAEALLTAIGNNSDRVMIYSTDKRYLTALPTELQHFNDRDTTREALVQVLISRHCTLSPATQPVFYAFELKREVQVVEKFTLGEGRSPATLVWNQQAMDCFKQSPSAKVLLIGINSQQEYLQATQLGADFVMVDSPAQAKRWHTAMLKKAS